jgi:hypothetical protein
MYQRHVYTIQRTQAERIKRVDYGSSLAQSKAQLLSGKKHVLDDLVVENAGISLTAKHRLLQGFHDICACFLLVLGKRDAIRAAENVALFFLRYPFETIIHCHCFTFSCYSFILDSALYLQMRCWKLLTR